MAEFPNRSEHRAPMAHDLAKLTARHRRRLLELMGSPPDPSRVPESFWDDCRKELEDELAVALLLLFLTSATMHGLDYDSAETYGTEWANNRAEQSAESIIDTTRTRLHNADERSGRHFEAVSTGSPRSEISDAEHRANIREAVNRDFGPDRAASIARNESNVAMVEGGEVAVNLLGIECTAWWRHTANAEAHHAGAEVDPCPECTPYLDTEQATWGGERPGFIHPNCILPGNLVVPLGEIIAATKSFYDGPCVEITLTDGGNLTCTENHPILTSAGWKAAGLLQVGDDVFSTAVSQGMGLAVDPHANQVPTRIEDLFATASMSPGVVSCRVPVSAEHFHGDGMRLNGDIEVQFAKSHLRPTDYTATCQHCGKLYFVSGREVPEQFLMDGGRLQFESGTNATGGGNVRGCGLGGELLVSHLGCSDQSGLAPATEGDAKCDKSTTQGAAANSHFDRQGIVGLTGDVAGNDGVWDNDTRRTAETSHIHRVLKSFGPHSNLIGQFIQGIASDIPLSQIVKVRKFKYAGHVYDLSVSGTHAFLCGSIVVSNCDCYIEYIEIHTGATIGTP